MSAYGFLLYDARLIANSEACGGPNRLSVYSNGPVTALPVPTVQTTGLPGNWQYVGCLECVRRLIFVACSA